MTRFARPGGARPPRRGLNILFPSSAPAAPEIAIVIARPGDALRAAGGTISDLHGGRVIHLGDGAPMDVGRAVEAGFWSRKEYAAAMREHIEAAFHGEMETIQLDLESGRLSQNLAGLTLMVADLLRSDWPDIILSQPYEGVDPDQDAAAFAVQAACALLASEGRMAPARLEMAARGLFLAYPYAEAAALRLDEAQSARKKAMVEALGEDASAMREVEVFRKAPHYDFTRAPHPGLLKYELDELSPINGARWRRLAGEALRVLGLVNG